MVKSDMKQDLENGRKLHGLSDPVIKTARLCARIDQDVVIVELQTGCTVGGTASHFLPARSGKIAPSVQRWHQTLVCGIISAGYMGR
eukprot:288137-Karenia_brevis.AAC.1